MTTDGRLGQLRLGAAALALVALGAAMAGVAADRGSAGGTPTAALPLEPLAMPSMAGLADGLGHYVVFVPSVGDSPPPASSAAPDAVDALLDDDPDGFPALALDDLAVLGDLVDHLDGDGASELVAVLTDGRRIPVRTAEPAAVAGSVAAPPQLAALAADPSTEDVTDIGGGWYAVTTRAPRGEFLDLTDRLELSVTDDVPILAASDDEHSGLLWGLENLGGQVFGGILGVEDVDADGVEARAVETGAGVIVAVIDSGADPTHPDLPDFWVNVDEDCTNRVDDDHNGYVDDCNGWDFYNDDNTPVDPGVDNKHGTHVTGTIAAVPDNGIGVAGLAPGVTIMNLKALQNGSTWMSTTAAAVRYAVDNGASVINASWGSSGATRAQVPELEDAIDYARDRGVIVVAAAGNNSADLALSPTFPASFPQDNVISVGAHMADGRAAAFSNRGDVEVDLHAPGHYIVSTVPGGGYSALQGTSMAAPHVTAAVALLQAADPGATIGTVRGGLLETVDRRPELAGLSVTGGSLNAARALGIDPGTAGDPFEVTFHGLDRLVAGEAASINVSTVVRDTAVAGSRPVVIRATFLTAVDGIDYGLVDLPVTVDHEAMSTDEHAQVILSDPAPAAALVGGHTTNLQVALPAGTHAFVIELVDAHDPDAAYGPAAVVFTEVPEATPTTTTTAAAPAVVPSPAPAPVPDAPTAPPPTTTAPTTTAPAPAATPAPGRAPAPSPAPTVTTSTTAAPPAGDAPAPSGSGGTSPNPTTTTPRSSGGSSPAVTVPPTTVPTATVPDAIEPVTRAGMTLLKLSPSWGPTTGGNIVIIQGVNLPANPLVLVGPFPAAVSRASSDSIVVEMPPSFPGIYDVSVIDDRFGFATLRHAYTYASAKPAPGDVYPIGPVLPPDYDPRQPIPYPVSSPTSPTTSAPASAGTPTPSRPGRGSPGVSMPVTTTTTIAPGAGPVATTIPADPTTTLPTPPGRPRLQLAGDSSGAVPGAHRVVLGSPIDLLPTDWAARSCRRPACGADMHSP